LAGKKIVWAYIASHWDAGIDFPIDSCRIANEEGVVPLVGVMPWSSLKQSAEEPIYTLERIIDGDFDGELLECAEKAGSLGFPIMMEFGPEANGSWFPWSGAWNGRGSDEYGERGFPDGPERFRDAYRRVARIFRDAGADNVTWVFHIAADGSPKEEWNSAKYYYPGDEWVDWIGASIYGRLRGDSPARKFDDIMKKIYPGLCALSPSKPIALLEAGVSDSPKARDKPEWIEDLFIGLLSFRYPRVRAVSWWNKVFRPDGTRSSLEIDSSPRSLLKYREGVKNLDSNANWGGY
jgi:hypothetical protein